MPSTFSLTFCLSFWLLCTNHIWSSLLVSWQWSLFEFWWFSWCAVSAWSYLWLTFWGIAVLAWGSTCTVSHTPYTSNALPIITVLVVVVLLQILCTVVYSPLACSAVSDSTSINCLSTTSPIVYTVHSPMMATVLPPAGMSPIVYMVHSLLLSPIFPVSPWHGGTFLAVSYCTFCVQHSISNHWLSLVPSCYPLNKAALDQHCSLDVCCLHGVCQVSEMQTMLGHLQTILIKLSNSNHCVNTSMVCVEDFCQVQFHLRFTCSCMLNCFSCITSSKLVAAQFPWACIRRMVLALVYEGGSTVGSTRPRYLFPRSSHKTLGHLKEPADAQCRQYQELLQKSNGSTAFLWSCSLTREETWTYCYASYLPKVCCPLANSHFKPTFDQGAISSNHPKMRVQQEYEARINLWTTLIGRGKLWHLYDQPRLEQLELFLWHWRQHSEAGRLLKCVVA